MLEHITLDCQCEGKLCTKCNEVKCIKTFSKDKQKRGGLRYTCKTCDKAWFKVYHLEHKEQINARINKRFQENAEQVNALRRAHYTVNAKSILARNSEYQRTHVEQIKARRSAHYRSNRERILTRSKLRYQRIHQQVKRSNRAYYLSHVEQVKRNSKAHYRKNLEQCKLYAKTYWRLYPEKTKVSHHRRRSRKLHASGSFTSKEWLALLEKHNHICLCCKRNDVALTIDHIVPLFHGGTNSIENLQPLCKSCNSKKGTKIIDYRFGPVSEGVNQ